MDVADEEKVVLFNMLMEAIQSSSDSSSEDEELLLLLDNDRGPPKARIDNYVEIINQQSDEDFKSHFRIRRDTFDYILQHIQPVIENEDKLVGRKTIAAEKQFLIALWCLASPDSYRSLSEKFGIGKSTAWRAVRRVCDALYALRTLFIVWPNAEECASTWNAIENRWSFPKVVGAVDGTHINISAPHAHPESYVNRKGKHSIQLQVVCDHNLKFIHCYTGQAGSVHDYRVFRLSGLQDFMTDEYFPEDSHLLGDSAYTNQKHLLVPYRDNGHLTDEEILYNERHSSARMMVERAIGLFKIRWRCLLDTLWMHRTDLIPQTIISCCVLHNICLLRNDEIDIPLCLTENNNDNNPVVQEHQIDAEEGNIKRENIKNLLSQLYLQ